MTKVLVADDDADVRALVGEYLTGHGFEVLYAANGLETLLQVKHQRPNAVVLDVNMPRLSGLEALKRIHAFDPSIAVAVVSGHPDDVIRRQAMAYGARAVLSKPLVLPELLSSLASGEASPPTSSREASSRATEQQPPGSGHATRGTVLVVDDDPDVLDVLQEFLAQHAYRVSRATDGAAALREIVRSAPDIVLLDIEMPGLNGVDAVPAIRAVAPDTAVIMVSGSTDPEKAKRALAHGAFDYVVKPVDFDYLAKSLELACRMRGLM